MRFLGLLCRAACLPMFSSDVLKHHIDVASTGAVLDETALAPATLRSQGGKLFSLVVGEQIYPQPPIVTGLEMGIHNVVFVATMRNMVYAFDAENGTPFWSVPLGSAMPNDRIPKNGRTLLGQYTIRAVYPRCRWHRFKMAPK